MKILALTSIRSDYDLLSPLYKLLDRDKDIDFRLLVSGAHLSKSFGYSKSQITNDGFTILMEIESLIHSDTAKSRLKTASIFLQNSIDIVSNFNPDVLLYAGDREDVIIGGLLSIYLNIPSIHFYGGDHEEDGHQDTYIRHATSKLSSFHFVSSAEHKKRLLALGESEKRIFNIGSISLDKFYNFIPVDLNGLFEKNIPDKFALLIFHPLIHEKSGDVFQKIIDVLEDKNIFTVVSFPNTDPGYEDILAVIKKYQTNNNFLFYKNLERDMFLSLFYKSQFIIGNSSAGISEAATLKKPTINVGLRQKNRLQSDNIIYVDGEYDAIFSAIDNISTEKFQKSLQEVVNFYGDGQSAKRAYKLIKTINFNEYLIKDEDPLEKENHE